MPRKTLKQKLKSKLRVQREVIGSQQTLLKEEHEQAGITINFECQKLQVIAMAHGVMATLIEAKNHFDVESEAFKALEKVSQTRIGQCYAKLLSLGLSGEEANQRIQAGY